MTREEDSMFLMMKASVAQLILRRVMKKRGKEMTCDKCKHFKILYEPLRTTGKLLDMGRAKCEKHNLITDFANHGKFKRLECPDNADMRGAE